jgi:hypothetical protein
MLMIEEGSPGSLSQKLMARTPWVFLLDEAGIIQAQGHGSQIADLERTLRHRFERVAKP